MSGMDFGNSPLKQDTSGKNPKLKKSEHPDTEITDSNLREKRIDIEDRIGIIKEDIWNNDGKATTQQQQDLASLRLRLARLK